MVHYQLQLLSIIAIVLFGGFIFLSVILRACRAYKLGKEEAFIEVQQIIVDKMLEAHDSMDAHFSHLSIKTPKETYAAKVMADFEKLKALGELSRDLGEHLQAKDKS